MSIQENKTAPQILEAGLSLGSNMGNRIYYLRAAIKAITGTPGTAITAISPVYETEPVGVKEEYRDMPYLNAALILQTTLTAKALSKAIHEIEKNLGRVRTADRFAPRTIDIDILYAGNTVSADPALTLPHPRWAQRRFVLQPLADIHPHLRIPGSNRTVTEHLAALPSGSEAVHKLTDTLTP
ncbi:MAG: 2-amino-4-hydroxy-6-hydroxymethyldihydropteridine diphosphokinase [Kiritimatiellia bacterium]